MGRNERVVHHPAGTEEGWVLLARPDDIGRWVGGEVSVDAVPGTVGELVETDGGRRRVAVDDVELGARITWRWWHDDAPESASGVEITLVPVDGGTRVTVVEQPLAPTGAAGASAKASVRTGRAGWSPRPMHLEDRKSAG